jgi:putative membrane protein
VRRVWIQRRHHGHWHAVILGLTIVAVVLLLRGFGVRPDASEPGLREKTALDILGERYARGEIDKPEFEEKRRDLEGMGQGT